MKDKKTIKLIFFLLALLIVTKEPPTIFASQINSNAGISFTENEDSRMDEEDNEKEKEGIGIENGTVPSFISSGTISTLPQTGEKKESVLIIVGLMLMVLSMRIISHLKKKVTQDD